MNIILLQSRLTIEEIDLLLKEFPQFLFLSLSESSYTSLSKEQWLRVEIIYGSKLTPRDLELAHQLRWVHCTQAHLNKLCLDEIEKRGNILLSNTPDENFSQVGEFVMSACLAFAKNMLHWKEANRFPGLVWDSKWRDSMWCLKDKVFLQIGLNPGGSEIARRARQLDMVVWGVEERRSFHPSCQETFTYREVSSLLPKADIICMCQPKIKAFENWLNDGRLRAMKDGCVLIVIGSSKFVDEEALAQLASAGKFRGVLIDGFYLTPIRPDSSLWKAPNVIITPDVATRPKSQEKQAFRLFLFNLRQYLHGNFKDMRHLYTETY